MRNLEARGTVYRVKMQPEPFINNARDFILRSILPLRMALISSSVRGCDSPDDATLTAHTSPFTIPLRLPRRLTRSVPPIMGYGFFTRGDDILPSRVCIARNRKFEAAHGASKLPARSDVSRVLKFSDLYTSSKLNGSKNVHRLGARRRLVVRHLKRSPS